MKKDNKYIFSLLTLSKLTGISFWKLRGKFLRYSEKPINYEEAKKIAKEVESGLDRFSQNGFSVRVNPDAFGVSKASSRGTDK